MNRTFLVTIAVGTIITLYFVYTNSYRSKPRIVFCAGKNVQVAYIRLTKTDILIIKKGLPLYAERCLNRQLPYFDRTVELLVNARTTVSKSKKPPFPTFTIAKTFVVLPTDSVILEEMRLQVKDNSLVLIYGNKQKRTIPFVTRNSEKDEYLDLTPPHLP